MADFSIIKKVYYHNTDAGGVMYYGSYLEHLEEGRSEFLASRGIILRDYAQKGVAFPVVHFEIEYKAPARYGDVVKIFTHVEKVGNSSIHFAQEIKRADILLVKAQTIWACVGSDFKTQPVPDVIRQALV